jgi:uncharacterized phage protein (TIGR01671 family)
MSRQIKFRAWDGRRMSTVWKATFVGSNPTVFFTATQYNEPGALPMDDDRLSLMQFTGLQDKAGRDIYEGDVVKDRFGRIMQVQWWNFRLCWVAISETNFHHADLYDWVDFDYEKEEKSSTARVEVIGNVYENPELLTNLPTQSNG